jgi:hypothetical protein
MNTLCSDTQVIGETTSTLFTMTQAGAISAAVSMRNTGSNTANYFFQEFNGSAWVDLDVLGTPLNDTLSPGEVVMVLVESSYPQVRLQGNASGGTELDFAISRYFARSSGGAVPLLSLG